MYCCAPLLHLIEWGQAVEDRGFLSPRLTSFFLHHLLKRLKAVFRFLFPRSADYINECADCHPECHIVKPPFLFSCNCHFSDLRDQEAGLFPFTAFPCGRTLDSFQSSKNGSSICSYIRDRIWWVLFFDRIRWHVSELAVLQECTKEWV